MPKKNLDSQDNPIRYTENHNNQQKKDEYNINYYHKSNTEHQI